jgi:hypothetical protein
MNRLLLQIICCLFFVGNSQAQNVGIGINNPIRARLEIQGRVGATVALFGSDAFGVGVSADNPEIGFNYFFNNGTKTIKAGYGANFGMDPGNGNVYLGNFSGNQSSSDFGDISGYQYVLTVTQSGNLGVGTTSPSMKLDVTGQGRLYGPPLTSPGFFGNLTSGGCFFIRNNSNNYSLNFDAGQIQAIRPNPNPQLSGTFASTLLINPYGGNVGVGTLDPGLYKLAVNGNIRSKEVVVETAWADYVFHKNYRLLSLAELEKFIGENYHLPNIPSAEEIEKNGLSLGDLQKRMMEKIEELTLYIIEQNKKIIALEQKLGRQTNQ